MVTKASVCSSVEGEKLSFSTRQFYSKTPVYNEILNCMVYPFKLGIHGYVEITTPLAGPKMAPVYTTSLLNEEDAVQGGSIDGWATKPIKKPSVNSGVTGTHSATQGVLKGHCYAHVQSSHRDHMQSTDINERHPEVVLVVNPVYVQAE